MSSVQAGRIMLVDRTERGEHCSNKVSEWGFEGWNNQHTTSTCVLCDSQFFRSRVVMLSRVEQLSIERERVRARVRSWNSCFILIRYVGKGGCALKVAACNNSLISTGEVSPGTRCCLKWRPKSERTHQKNFISNARMRLIFVVWDSREEKKRNESHQNRCDPDRNWTQKWKDLCEEWRKFSHLKNTLLCSGKSENSDWKVSFKWIKLFVICVNRSHRAIEHIKRSLRRVKLYLFWIILIVCKCKTSRLNFLRTTTDCWPLTCKSRAATWKCMRKCHKIAIQTSRNTRNFSFKHTKKL